MNPNEMLKGAFETTEIIKERSYSLYTFGVTRLPYYFVARSEIDPKDTVIREGKVMVERPQILLPNGMSLIEGFEIDEERHGSEEDVQHILMTRKVLLPSLKYTNDSNKVDVESISVDEKIGELRNRLTNASDTATGIIRGEDRFFPFPLFLYVGKMIIRSTGDNLTDLFEKKGGFDI